jgi:uncharacterized protein (DUF2235 family)
MPKNLVLFSDGTGNSARKLFKTNVWRVYQAVDLTDPQDPKEPRQYSFYDDGVGTSSFKPLAVLGGAFGVGLARNVVDLYIFLCRMYEPGDRIYAFGFSRGAFTIRVLIGLVMTEGLLRYHGSEGDLKRLARDAYRTYRGKRFKSLNPLVQGLPRGARRRREPAGPAARAHELRPGGSHRRARQRRRGQVHFVGLWDTVDAYGLPVDELTRAIDACIWPLTMRDYNLNPRVLRAMHALSLDDERNAFHPRLWNEVPDPAVRGSGVEGANLRSTHLKDERISQVWFAGVHSNVGGGYPDDGLSYVSLLWILREACDWGLRLEAEHLGGPGGAVGREWADLRLAPAAWRATTATTRAASRTWSTRGRCAWHGSRCTRARCGASRPATTAMRPSRCPRTSPWSASTEPSSMPTPTWAG